MNFVPGHGTLKMNRRGGVNHNEKEWKIYRDDSNLCIGRYILDHNYLFSLSPSGPFYERRVINPWEIIVPFYKEKLNSLI